jgi:hypothetical protein
MRFTRTIRTAAATVVAIAGVTVGGVTPAHAATSNAFDVTYGNAFTRGTLTWFDRSIGVSGSLRTTDGNCRMATVTAYVDTDFGSKVVGNEIIEAKCSYQGQGTQTVPVSGTINTNIRGAANFILVCLRGVPYQGSDTPSSWPLLKNCQELRRP